MQCDLLQEMETGEASINGGALGHLSSPAVEELRRHVDERFQTMALLTGGFESRGGVIVVKLIRGGLDNIFEGMAIVAIRA